ncbi:MAG TPA: hypothetical protein VHX62_11890 [Solirubrobacteraceae bacterium]|nr:hypothetical protein [Solirubrobacteraceae bacterium]
MGERLGQPGAVIEPVDRPAQALRGRGAARRRRARPVLEQPGQGVELGPGPAVGQVVPGAAGPGRDALVLGSDRHRLQSGQHRPQRPQAAGGHDRRPALAAGEAGDMLGDQQGLPLEHRYGLVGGDALGRVLAPRQQPQDRRVPVDALAGAAGREQAGHPGRAVGGGRAAAHPPAARRSVKPNSRPAIRRSCSSSEPSVIR